MLNKSDCVFIDNNGLTLLTTTFYRPVDSILIKICFLSVCPFCFFSLLYLSERVTAVILLHVHKCPKVTRPHSEFLLCAHLPTDDSSAGRIWGLLLYWKGRGTMTEFQSSAS